MSDDCFFLVYRRPDRASRWSLVGLDSDGGKAEEMAARKRRDSGGLAMVRRWTGFARKERIPESLPADWRE